MEPKDEIKERADVVEVVSEHLQLKPAGSGSFKALCPFHGEKSPSFYVSRAKQIWHCFGCGKGGDVFSFLMEMEGMSFPEAMRHLGKKYGVEIPEYRPNPKSNEKEFLIEMHEISTKFYETLLHEHEKGAQAREYIASRGIDTELAKKFRLGYAPDSWEALVTFLKKRGYGEERIVAAGLAKKRRSGSGVIDQFRDRVVIPLMGPRGRVLGYTGRTLKQDDEKAGPKYLNTPETLIYHKSDVLFGFSLAKTAIRHEGSVIVVEGNLDVVASHKAGVEHVIASSGTALTESQLRQLKKQTSKILFAFDADKAGFAAAQRGIRLAQEMGFDVAVISIPEDAGKDPDDVVQKDPDAWKQLAQNPVHIMEYYFENALASFDLNKVEGKRELAKFICGEIARLQDAVEREHWMQKLSDIIHVDLAVLRDVVRKAAGQQVRPVKLEEKIKPNAPKPEVQKTSREEQAASFLVGLLLHVEELADPIMARVRAESLPEEPWGRLYKNVVELYTSDKLPNSTQKTLHTRLCDHLNKHEQESDVLHVNAAVLRAERATDTLSRDQVRDELDRHIDILHDASTDAKRKQLEAAIRQAEGSGDSERLKALIEQYSKLL